MTSSTQVLRSGNQTKVLVDTKVSVERKDLRSLDVQHKIRSKLWDPHAGEVDLTGQLDKALQSGHSGIENRRPRLDNARRLRDRGVRASNRLACSPDDPRKIRRLFMSFSTLFRILDAATVPRVDAGALYELCFECNTEVFRCRAPQRIAPIERAIRRYRRPRPSYCRKDLNAVRSSLVISSGCSHAAKCPPLSSLL
jgi:hypothetical protein